MRTREKILNENNVHLYRIHFFLYEKQIKVSLKLSWRILWYTFIRIRDRVLLYSQLCKNNSLQDGAKT